MIPGRKHLCEVYVYLKELILPPEPDVSTLIPVSILRSHF